MVEDLKARIKKHEGFVPKIYRDSLGYATIGYGHLVLQTDHFEDGVTYTEEELNAVFEKDFQNALDNANKLIKDIPLEISDTSFPDEIEIRGEIFIKKKDFYNFDTDIEEQFRNYIEIENYGDKF